MEIQSWLSQKLNHLTAFFGERNDFGFDEQGPIHTMVHRLIEYYPLASLLPSRSYDEQDQLFYNHQSVGFVIEILPLSGPSEAFAQQLTALLKDSFPEKSCFQCLMWSSPKVGKILKRWQVPIISSSFSTTIKYCFGSLSIL